MKTMSDWQSLIARVGLLTTEEEVNQFRSNAAERGAPKEVLDACDRRAAELYASRRGLAADDPVMVEFTQTVTEYEQTLASRYAGRLWPMVGRHGVLGTLERLVLNRKASLGFDRLAAEGRLHLTAEAIVARHPDRFSKDTVAAANKRLEKVNR